MPCTQIYEPLIRGILEWNISLHAPILTNDAIITVINSKSHYFGQCVENNLEKVITSLLDLIYSTHILTVSAIINTLQKINETLVQGGVNIFFEKLVTIRSHGRADRRKTRVPGYRRCWSRMAITIYANKRSYSPCSLVDEVDACSNSKIEMKRDREK